MPPRRSFVFITNIPDYLLQPLAVGNNNHHNKLRASRDPRYERLRSFLSTHTSGVMHVMHLETRGYALALYASEEEALAACKTTITPKYRQCEYPPMVLRILERPRPAPLQSVYTPTVTIEGETILKEELANTRGLELVYRGRAIARWCPNTLSQQDCPFGASCNWIHKCAYQQTVRKRPRLDPVSQQQQQKQPMSSEELTRLRHVTHNTKCGEEQLVPTDMKFDFSVYVPVAYKEAVALVDSEGTGGSNRLVDDVIKRVEAACSAYSGPYFVKFAFCGGAPWDWSLHNTSLGLSALRKRAPFPTNGAPTPLERDIFTQQLLYHMNQMNRFDTIALAVHALAKSPKVRRALQRELEYDQSLTSCNDKGDKDAVSLHLCVRPWLFLPTVGVEATVFLEGGGEVLRGIVQRKGAVRLMISHALLRQQEEKQGMDFSRFAVLGSGQDLEAESYLESEIQRMSLLVKRSAQRLQQYIRQQRDRFPPGAAWCVHIAVSPPPLVPFRPQQYGSGVEQQKGECKQEESEERVTSKCVVLSLQEYQPAYEEHVALHGELRAGEVMWNTRKHGYVALIPREMLERLRLESQVEEKE
ncbi:hypothetical protein, conserved [Trypanosoma brucei brucei TREU927]|uniref:C3H1-type domain-containing protein n=1 Tax=Trypanosoma brucei brucei (strain 927/4 GUTat10.1) TaxID=185431 RepID=Q57XW7_TRYB2|nr:hypothetical protein, conserved [Trypanosoma brucei brucei TREU927]AAX69552.1 hypothetical protein, conserved [Trypanosoma brucei]AAZ10169.1 hypothetical protein, conserved [Trypanosoma brucei brucei TREU927]